MKPRHELRTFVRPTHLEVLAAEPLTLDVTASCADGCDLEGTMVTVSSREQILATASLVRAGSGRYGVAVPLHAPSATGDHAWTVDVSGGDGVSHHDCVDIVVVSRPHSTSLAVWGAPSPIAADRPLELKLGVKCVAACRLAGHRVVISDAGGIQVGEAFLGETPLAGTAALYWATVTAKAPSVVGIATWSVRFDAGALRVAHDEAAAMFTFSVVPRPQHRVVVQLVGQGSQSALSHAEIRLGLYVGVTDAAGLATFDVPAGSYGLGLRKDGYAVPEMTIEIDRDQTLRVEAPEAMTQAEREARLAQFVDIEWG